MYHKPRCKSLNITYSFILNQKILPKVYSYVQLYIPFEKVIIGSKLGYIVCELFKNLIFTI